MTSRDEIKRHCLLYEDVYEDYPFDPYDWCAMRHKGNSKCFAFIFKRDGKTWVNVKCDTEWGHFWRDVYPSVLPAYHMNKEHWNSIILDDSIPDDEIFSMIKTSYELTNK